MKACQFICRVLTCWRDWLLDGTPKSFTALGFHRSCEGWKYKMPTIIIEYIRHPNSVWKTFRYCLFANAKNVLKSIAVYTVWFCWTSLYTVINNTLYINLKTCLTQIDLIIFESECNTGIRNLFISSTFWCRSTGAIFKSYSRDGAVGSFF